MKKPSEITEDFWLYSATRLYFASSHYTGKWIIDCKNMEECDEVWAKVYEALHDDLLGPAAKASTAIDNPTQIASHRGKIVVIYVADYEEEEKTLRVLKSLREIGIKGRLRFKRDLETFRGLYGERSFWMYSTDGTKAKRYAWNKDQ